MGRRVLLIDDDASLGELLVAELRARGFQPQWHGSAEEALAALGAGGFDVVATDLAMPGMGGVALCERLAREAPSLPVVVFTAYGTLEAAVAALRAGARDFIAKPVDPEALARALERVLLGPAREEVLMTLDEVERRHIERVLHSVHGNKTQAAQLLGLDRKTLYRKLERYARRAAG